MRVTSIVLVSVAATLLLASVSTGSWFKRTTVGDFLGLDENSETYGLWGRELCYGPELFDDMCTDLSYSVGPEYDDQTAFVVFGKLTAILGILTGLGLAVLGVLAGLRVRAIRLMYILSVGESSAALVCAVGFVLFKPGFLTEGGATMSYGFPLFAVGGLIGMIGGMLGSAQLRREGQTPMTALSTRAARADLPIGLTRPMAAGAPRPANPTPVPLQSPPPKIPSCGSCDGPTYWIPRYKRYLCHKCRIYT